MFDPKSQHFYTLNSSTTHTKGITTNLGYPNISTRVRKPGQNYENYTRVNVGDIQFKAQNTDDESDVCSPPLWKSSTPTDYESLSPNSRTRAIIKGQRELMEMARNMPESCYELSLRDMVESRVVESPRLDDEERCLVDEKNFNRRSVKEILRQESKKAEKRMDRVKSASIEKRGLFLKMMFPVSIRSKKKKNSVTSTTKRVSPKVETLGKSSTENDWWKKKFPGSSGSESGVTNTSIGSSQSTSSSGNSSNNSLKSKGWSSGCWSFAFSGKNKKKSN